MTAKLTPQQQLLTARALKAAGHSGATVSNPFLKNSETARYVQGLIREENPVEAAAMQMAAAMETDGIPAAVVLIQNGEMSDDTPELQRMMMEWDSAYCQAAMKQKADADKALEQKYSDRADASRMNRAMQQAGGNQARAEHLIKKEDAMHQRQQQEIHNARFGAKG